MKDECYSDLLYFATCTYTCFSLCLIVKPRTRKTESTKVARRAFQDTESKFKNIAFKTL